MPDRLSLDFKRNLLRDGSVDVRGNNLPFVCLMHGLFELISYPKAQ
jgi:hypothetical protein